jgi:hypothetical protein
VDGTVEMEPGQPVACTFRGIAQPYCTGPASIIHGLCKRYIVLLQLGPPDVDAMGRQHSNEDFLFLAQSVTRRNGGSISWYLVDSCSDFLDQAGKIMEWCLGIDRSGMQDRIEQWKIEDAAVSSAVAAIWDLLAHLAPTIRRLCYDQGLQTVALFKTPLPALEELTCRARHRWAYD